MKINDFIIQGFGRFNETNKNRMVKNKTIHGVVNHSEYGHYKASFSNGTFQFWIMKGDTELLYHCVTKSPDRVKVTIDKKDIVRLKRQHKNDFTFHAYVQIDIPDDLYFYGALKSTL